MLIAGGPGEKIGNTSWVRCPGCDAWFHAAEAMLNEGAPDLHCPQCHREFGRAEAAQIARSGGGQ